MKKSMCYLLFFLPTVLAAQQLEVVATGSQQLDGPKTRITATIGEVFVNIPNGKKAYVSEGFQQGFLPEKYLADRDLTLSTHRGPLEATLFPDPATDRVFVKFEQAPDETRYLRIFNAGGSLVQIAETRSDQVAFDLKTLAPGQYRVTVQTSDPSQTLSLPFSKINP